MAIFKIFDGSAWVEVPIEDPTLYMRHDGTVAMTGDLNMGGQAITNVGNVDGRDVSADGIVLDAHVADTTDPHGAIMSVTTRLSTPEVRRTGGDLTLEVFDPTADRVVFVKNSGPGKVADLNVERNIIVGGTVDGIDVAGTVVTADANLTDDALVRGDGGGLDAKTSVAILTDAGAMSGLTQLQVDGPVGILIAPSATIGCLVQTTGSVILNGLWIATTYTGTMPTITGITSIITHAQAAPTGDQSALGFNNLVTNEGVAPAGNDIFCYGARFQAICDGDQDSATGDIFAYSCYLRAAKAGQGTNSAGRFYATTLYVEDAAAALGTTTVNQTLCALFAGDVQINSGKKLILQGSATSKGNNYLYYDVGADEIRIQHSGDIPLRVGPTDIIADASFTLPTSDGIDYGTGVDGDVDLMTVDVTGTPKFWWDESADIFSTTKGLMLEGTSRLFMRDSGLYMYSSANGTLNIVSDILTVLSAIVIEVRAANFFVYNTNGVDIAPGSDTDCDLVTVTVTGAPRQWWDESENAFAMTHRLILPEGVQTKYAVDDVADPPTDAELDAAFGDPTVVGSGFVGILDDNDAGTDCYVCWTTGAAGEWFYVKGTKAV